MEKGCPPVLIISIPKKLMKIARIPLIFIFCFRKIMEKRTSIIGQT